ncbi:glycosyltransferase, partial [Klebsiella pneumoniae]|uniref:glycosyltransferase n=1 Tax=Klebsiella pneumoniae TaxID=573 RepID=UPI0013D3F25C
IKSRFPAITSFDVLHNDAAEGHLGRALGARRHIDRFIAVSEGIGRSLAAGGADAKAVTVIPNGIDYEGAFNPQRVDRQALRKRLG